MSKPLDTPIEYLPSIGPARAKVLKDEANVHTFKDLLYYMPFRHVDKTVFHHIKDVDPSHDVVQLKGKLIRINEIKQGRRSRMTAVFSDGTGYVELIWFQGVKWLKSALQVQKEYILYGKLTQFNKKWQISHPELELVQPNAPLPQGLDPVYPSGEKLTKKGFDAKGFRKIVKVLFEQINERSVPETLPSYLVEKMRLMPRFKALQTYHFPDSLAAKNKALRRLKFEELFLNQLVLLFQKKIREKGSPGYVFSQIGPKFNRFFTEKLPFELTGAQKRVIKEIRTDLGSGHQMNRLVQGDVGSGKTMVALMSMLMAIDNGYQACMLAPTEILAQQHYESIQEMVKGLGIRVAFLSGSVKGKQRAEVLKWLALNEIHILIGTHAILEPAVQFSNLGLALIDEQHRFGVAQRAKLWKKSTPNRPHVLLMTATPIPRTLSMTVHGDLDVSIIDELPPGRKSIETLHFRESMRLRMYGMIREEIAKGRQVYIVYPMIDETEDSDLVNLQRGYDTISDYFAKEKYKISVVHGKMKPADKDAEMQRFAAAKTQIMVATTVIEVGVNIPNATLMVIENAERFGLSQLHQLRGRVGRGGDQAYCLLMTGHKLGDVARARIGTMVASNDGFHIAEVDLKLRGPGDIYGTQQSGRTDFLFANLIQDQDMLKTARDIVVKILQKDPALSHPANAALLHYIQTEGKKVISWSQIS